MNKQGGNVATLVVNRDNLEQVRGGRTLKDFAQEIGVDMSTISRVLSGKAEPGPKVIAGLLITYPFPFDHYFTPTDAA